MIVDRCPKDGASMPQEKLSISRMVLVRHARPVIDPETPPSLWELEGDAHHAVEGLAESVRHVGCDGVVVSPEPKARTTGDIIAGCLDVPIIVDPAFREQGGRHVAWLPDREFLAAVEDHFVHGDRIVLGTETSHQASERFANGIQRMSRDITCPIVVTHGRVMCGYLAKTLGVDPVQMWRSLRLPDAFMVDLGARSLQRIESWKKRREG